jgi:TRAP-type C4-dicarboxylate transport system permease large subunit
MEWFHVLVLILVFGTLLLLGVPVAFAIGIGTLVTLLLGMAAEPALITIAQRMATGLDSFALLAIPFFILAGQLMNRGGIARRLIDFAKAVIGMFPGGLAHVHILASMLFGAISGSAVAAASAIGGVVGPRMVDEGYDRDFSAAVNITSATTGLVIPPSNILIVYSLASGGVSIGALFLAGYLPGILVGLSLMLVAGYFAVRMHYPVAGAFRFGEAVARFLSALPSLLLLVVVIGGIVAGIFTATEAAAVAVLYSGILAFIYREIRVRDLPQILLATVGTTAIVMLLIGTSTAMSWLLSYENNVILLVVGTFMDMTPAVLIFTPIFLPVVTSLGMDPTHFGIVMVLNLCIGLCTPPVGSVLFVGCGVAGTSITRVIRPLLPMYVAMVLALIVVTFVPWLSLWLPGVFGF